MKYHNIHIGQLIKQKFDEKNAKRKTITKTQLAKAALCCRSNVYHIFDKKSIDTDSLIRISILLDYPFLEEYIVTKPQITKTQIVLDVELKDGTLNIKQIEDND